MKIPEFKIYLARHPRKNWRFARVETEQSIPGTSEGTVRQLSRTAEAAIRENKAMIVGWVAFRTASVVARGQFKRWSGARDYESIGANPWALVVG